MKLFAIIISLGALIVSYFSWLANTKPVLIFFMNNKTMRYMIKNVGKGPAMNIVVSYVVRDNSNEWINPVKCYSLEAGNQFDLDWLAYKDDLLLLNTNENHKSLIDNKETKSIGMGKAKYGVMYSSAFGLKMRYISICEHDVTSTNIAFFGWKDESISKIWELHKAL